MAGAADLELGTPLVDRLARDERLRVSGEGIGVGDRKVLLEPAGPRRERVPGPLPRQVEPRRDLRVGGPVDVDDVVGQVVEVRQPLELQAHLPGVAERLDLVPLPDVTVLGAIRVADVVRVPPGPAAPGREPVQLRPEPGADLAVPVEQEQQVGVVGEGPEERQRDRLPERGRGAERGEQQARGAVGLDRPDEVGGVEDRDLADLERGVAQVGVLADRQGRAADPERPVGGRLAAGRERGVGDAQFLRTDPLDRRRAHDRVVLVEVADGVLDDAELGLDVVDQPGAGQRRAGKGEHHVAGRHDLPGRHREDDLVGLDRAVAGLEVDVAAQAPLGLGAHGLAGPQGRRLGQLQLELGLRRAGILGERRELRGENRQERAREEQTAAARRAQRPGGRRVTLRRHRSPP